MISSLFNNKKNTEYGISSFQGSHAGESLRHSVHEETLEIVVLVLSISYSYDSLTSSINIITSETLSGTHTLSHRSLNMG